MDSAGGRSSSARGGESWAEVDELAEGGKRAGGAETLIKLALTLVAVDARRRLLGTASGCQDSRGVLKGRGDAED